MKKLLVLLTLVVTACQAETDESLSDAAVDGTPSDCGCTGPIDAPIDADDPCASCGVDQICVQFFNGTCGELFIECQDRAPGCDGTCNNCDVPHCRSDDGDAGIPFTCATSSCPDEHPAAFQCYGP